METSAPLSCLHQYVMSTTITKVHLRAEETSFAYEQSDQNLIMRFNLSETLRQTVEPIFGQSIQFLRTIDGDDGDAVLVLERDPLLQG